MALSPEIVRATEAGRRARARSGGAPARAAFLGLCAVAALGCSGSAPATEPARPTPLASARGAPPADGVAPKIEPDPEVEIVCRPRTTLDEVAAWRLPHQRVRCEREPHCGARRYATVEECVRRRAHRDEDERVFPSDDRIVSGELALDPVAAQACLERPARDVCSPDGRAEPVFVDGLVDDPCRRVFTRRCTTRGGEWCQSLEECGPGFYCELPDRLQLAREGRVPETACMAGRCVPTLPPGARCTSASQCRRGSGRQALCLSLRRGAAPPVDLRSVIQSGRDLARAAGRTCVEVVLDETRASTGERCAIVAIADRQVVARDCEPPAFCEPNERLEPRCQLGRRIGEPCQHWGHERCARGLFCSGRCTDRPGIDARVAGGPCSERGVCSSGLACRNGRCVEASREGAPCEPRYLGGDAVEWCEPPLACDRATSTCRPDAELVDGQPCWRDAACRSGCCRRGFDERLVCLPEHDCCSPADRGGSARAVQPSASMDAVVTASASRRSSSASSRHASTRARSASSGTKPRAASTDRIAAALPSARTSSTLA